MARVVNMDHVKSDRLAPELAAELREHGSVHCRVVEIDDVAVWRQAARRAGRLLAWHVRTGIGSSPDGGHVWAVSDDWPKPPGAVREMCERFDEYLGELAGYDPPSEEATFRPRLIR
jgi:hypothetical protein